METGMYFRIKRNDKYQAVDFGEMTYVERTDILEGKDKNFLREMIQVLVIALTAQNDVKLGRLEDYEVD